MHFLELSIAHCLLSQGSKRVMLWVTFFICINI